MKSFIKIVFGLLIFVIITSSAKAQQGFDNRTRALYVFDIARYIDYGEALDSMAIFRVGVLAKDSELYWEMANLAKTRKEIQGKPVTVVVFRDENRIEYTNVLYVANDAGFNLKKVNGKIAGKPTLLITEGYEFGSSMFNFIVVNDNPKFEINEEMLQGVGLSIPSTLLAQAVKTREDWEELYDITNEELEKQLEVVRQQKVIIAEQKEEILKQKALLDSLDIAIAEKEKILVIKQKELKKQSVEISSQTREIARQRSKIADQQREVTAQRDTLELQKADIDKQLGEINEQLSVIDQQEQKIKVQLESIEKQKIFLYAALFVLILLSFLAYYIYRGYKIKKEANIKLEEKNRTIMAQKDEIEKQRDLAETQRDQIAYQKKHITDSIMYAKRIQTALLPALELFSDEIEHFVLYRPLDIVSGDFYWVSRENNTHVIIAADCTGHGVPGAFMSMLGVTMINEIVNGKGVIMPDQILNMLRDEIVRSLKQSVDEDRVKDGMDMTISVIDYDRDKLWFAGANNPLCLVRNGELETYRGDKMPVSIHYKMGSFTLHEIDLKKGDCIYMFSDGYGDQFGGPKQKKFMVKNLKEKIVEVSSLPMIEQGEKLNQAFDAWKGESSQVDDVIIIGIRY
ncbi:MAG: YfiR/HmsC family protein [Bacteroidales bacterium]|nr:YfiR/HmsC family protein [Bacteroidales bacterium]